MNKRIKQLEEEIKLAKELLGLYKEIDKYKSNWSISYPAYPDSYKPLVWTDTSISCIEGAGGK